MKIKKVAAYTDIHFGKRNNSIIHNQDCLDFIDWFIEEVKKDSEISHIVFLGDFFESRSAINILTLDMAYQGVKKLNDLGLPIIHIVGNHDLHRRTTREIHSVNFFNELENFIIVDEPTIIDDCLFSPYIFDDEYPDLAEYNKCKYWYGHFEFKNFKITGYNTIMKHGPGHEQFNGPELILSGHFHKRQAKDNVVYIGNTFPMDYGDAGDNERGMITLDHSSGDIKFLDWPNMPKYHKTSLSKVLGEDWNPEEKMRVQCIVDVDITYSEAQTIKSSMVENHNLREFTLVESAEKSDTLSGDEDSVEDIEAKSVDDLVVESLESIDDMTNIKSDKLINIYTTLD